MLIDAPSFGDRLSTEALIVSCCCLPIARCPASLAVTGWTFVVPNNLDDMADALLDARLVFVLQVPTGSHHDRAHRNYLWCCCAREVIACQTGVFSRM